MARGKRKAPSSCGMRSAAKRSKGLSSRYNGKTKKRKSYRKRRPIRRRRYTKKRKFSKGTKLGNQQTYVQSYCDSVTVPTRPTSGTDTVGKQCQYIYPGVGGAFSYPLGGLNNLLRMGVIIANQEAVVAGPFAETKFMVIDSRQSYHLVNQSNGNAVVTAFYCRGRADLPNTTYYTNLRAIIGDGLQQRGLPGNAGGNASINDDLFTPFDSHRFCSMFKVTKVQKFTMDPGSNRIFHLKTGAYYFDTARYELQPSATSDPVLAQNFSHRRGEIFIIFKFSGQPTDDGAGNLSYTSPKLDLITENHYNFRSINRQTPLITKDTPIGYGTSTNPNLIMVDESGMAQTEVRA